MTAGERMLERARAHMTLLEYLVRAPDAIPALRAQILEAAEQFHKEARSPIQGPEAPKD